MRVLLDQGTPVPLEQYLPHHTFRTAFREEAWVTLANGDPLTQLPQAVHDQHGEREWVEDAGAGDSGVGAGALVRP